MVGLSASTLSAAFEGRRLIQLQSRDAWAAGLPWTPAFPRTAKVRSERTRKTRPMNGEGRIVEPAPAPGTFDLMVDGVDELADLLLR